MHDDHWYDGSVLEAMSWRLASELARRHPTTTRVLRTHPGGGQYDCLEIQSSIGHAGSIMLNRAGTIQVLERFDGRRPDWQPTSWDEYIRADPRKFLDQLERASGLPTPATVPPSTPRTLTLRLLATIAATAMKTVHPIEIRPGMIDTSGDGGGVDGELFAAFPMIPNELREMLPDDPYNIAAYRFWFVCRDQIPVLAVEQRQGLAWVTHNSEMINLTDLYVECRRHLLVTALKLLRRVDNV